MPGTRGSLLQSLIATDVPKQRGKLAAVWKLSDVDTQRMHGLLQRRVPLSGEGLKRGLRMQLVSTRGAEEPATWEGCPEVLQDVADLKQTVEAVKAMVGKLVHEDKRPPKAEAKYSDFVKSSNEYALEVSFSGIPELKPRKSLDSETQDGQESHEDVKPARKEIFDHDEKLLNEVTTFLGINAAEISSFRRLGKFNANSSRPRQILVKFSHALTVDKILARSAMLKMYEPTFYDQKYLVFVSKSLNKEEQEENRNFWRKEEKF